MKTSKAKVNKKIREVRSDLARAVDCVSYYGKSDWADLQKADLFLQSAMVRIRHAKQELEALIKSENATA